MCLPEASFLAVGAELLLGDTLNKNAQWLSKQLIRDNVRMRCHLCVGDEESHIQDGLTLCKDRSSWVFVSGGLGPTRDDQTRFATSSWLKKPLVWNEDVWTQLSEKCSARGIPITPGHRKQCMFPEGAAVLGNEIGTACGFYVQHQSCHFWFLPGPPKEIESIWTGSIQKQIGDLLSEHPMRRETIFRWKIINLKESQLATLIEPVFSSSGIEYGFRLSDDFIELRFHVRADQEGEFIQLAKRVKALLGEHIEG